MTLWIRRAAGFAVVVLSVVPLYRLLPTRRTGLAGDAVARVTDLQAGLLWSAFLLALIPAMVAGRMVNAAWLGGVFAAAGRVLRRWPARTFAIGAGLLSVLLTVMTTLFLFEGRPNFLDSLVQLTQARYLAAGHLGGPSDLPGGFWHLVNTVLTASGWYSQYPPGHIVLLAAGLTIESPWLIGGLMMGGTAALSALAFQRLLPGREGLARGAALAVALSPFLMAHAAAFMNHSTAALLAVLAIYCGLRARDGSAGWALGAGAATAALAGVRPLAGIVIAIVVAGAIWTQSGSYRRLPGLASLAVLGGLPFVAAQLWYNRAAFGGPTIFGYGAAWGPSHGLGFHTDPWGHSYGVVEALLYTSADLTSLNLNLLETPLPLVTLAGLFLLMAARSLEPGERVIATWALAPVAANALYWHHGYFMGPRMLAEWAPAWICLAAISVAGLLERVPRRRWFGERFSPHAAALALIGAGLAGGLLLGPQRLLSYGLADAESDGITLPSAPERSLVFVHGSWESRLASRLAFDGIRLDVIETALRQNPTCLVQQHLDGLLENRGRFGTARSGLAALDLTPGRREFLPRVDIATGSRMRHDSDAPFPAACRRQANADRFGATDVSSMLWLGDLPGIENGGPMFARDLGPELNVRLMERYPGRSVWMYGYLEERQLLRLVPYAQGQAVLWDAR